MVRPINIVYLDVDLVSSLEDINNNSSEEEEAVLNLIISLRDIDNNSPLLLQSTMAIDHSVYLVDSLNDSNTIELSGPVVAINPDNKIFNSLTNNIIWCWSILLSSWLYVLAISRNN